jgi:hypothetical protein
VHFKHNHRVDVAQALGFLRAGKDTEEIIRNLFEAGHTPSTAKMLHELNLMDATNDPIELAKILANTRENPSIRKKKELEAKGCRVALSEKNVTLVVMTPVMLRAHARSFASETVFVDSTGSCDEVILFCRHQIL